VNLLFNKLISAVRNQASGSVIPFYTGRIYMTNYRNFKHDPKPLLLVVGSDSLYTVGINLHYVQAFYGQIEQFIIYMRQSNKCLTSKIIYDVLKVRLPSVPKIAYRKYFTSLLRGKPVSSGLYNGPDQIAWQVFQDPFIRKLNNRINAFTKGKAVSGSFTNSQDLQQIRTQITQSQAATTFAMITPVNRGVGSAGSVGGLGSR
jgi:hypothetical protein